MNSGKYMRHTEQLQQIFIDRFVEIHKYRRLLRIFPILLEASYKDAESTLQLEVMDLNAMMKFGLNSRKAICF